MLEDAKKIKVNIYRNNIEEFKQLDLDYHNEEILNFFAELKDYKNNSVIGKESLEVYFNEKSKIDPYKARKLVELIIKESKNSFWPKKGDLLGRCKIIELSGKGFTSHVYKAVHEFLGIEVAVKVLSDELKNDNPEIEKMFLQEAKNTAKLHHPNLVSIFDADKGDKYTYMIMEFVNGIDLEQLIYDKGHLEYQEAIRVMLKLCDALNYALDKGIIHRDIKPGNIMISKTSEVKLLDLGLSKIVNNKNDLEEGNIVGTPIYMSPEQFIDSNSVDHRADLYSLGATFYHLLTGSEPFKTKSYREIIMQKVTSDDFIPIFKGENYPDKIEKIISKLMARDKEERYQSYNLLKNDLLMLI